MSYSHALTSWTPQKAFAGTVAGPRATTMEMPPISLMMTMMIAGTE
jgi:hypothetical protein